MSEEIASADALIRENAELRRRIEALRHSSEMQLTHVRSALESVREALAQQEKATEDERVAARVVLRDTIYRIEAVLEDAVLDDGMVSVGALMRLDEHYFTVLKPLRDAATKGNDP